METGGEEYTEKRKDTRVGVIRRKFKKGGQNKKRQKEMKEHLKGGAKEADRI